MRIDSFNAGYNPERSGRTGNALTPYPEVQRQVEQQRQQPVSPALTQGLDNLARTRRAEAGTASGEILPVRTQNYAEFSELRPQVSSRAAQALASYASTSAMVVQSDAQEVLGLDLYA